MLDSQLLIQGDQNNGKEQRADARAVLVNGPVREKKADMTEVQGEGEGL